MAYRDDLEAAQARIASLEKSLAEAQGDSGRALVPVKPGALAPGQPGVVVDRGLSKKARLVEHRDGELSQVAFEECVDLLRGLDERGTVELRPGTLRWTGHVECPSSINPVHVSLTSRRSRTVVSLEVEFNDAHSSRLGSSLTPAWLAASFAGVALATVTPLLGLLVLPAYPIASNLASKWSQGKAQIDLLEVERAFDALVNLVDEDLENPAELPQG